MKRSISIVSFVSILALMLFVSGCGSNPTGGGGGAAPTGISTTTALSGIVLAPDGTSLASNQSIFQRFASYIVTKAYALTGHTPVSGAAVKAYNFYNNALIETTVSDPDGTYSFNSIPAGIDVVVVAEKTVSGNKLRFSAVIPNVDVQTSISGTIDAATTLVAEQLCTFLGQNFRVTVDDVLYMLSTAEASLNATTEVDLTVGAGNIRDNLGTGLISNEVTDPVILAMPNYQKMSVAAAKAMVQDIRDVGRTLTKFGSDEYQRQLDNLNDTVQPFANSLEATFRGSIEALFGNILIKSLPASVETYVNDVFIPYFTDTDEACHISFGRLSDYNSDVSRAISLTNSVTSGEYDVTATGKLITPEIGSTPGGIVIFHFPNHNIVTLTIESTSTEPVPGYDDVNAEFRFNMTNEAVPQVKFIGTEEVHMGVTSTETFIYSEHLKGSITDDVITNAMTFDADLSQTGTGSYPNYVYQSATFRGTLVSDCYSFSGTATCNLSQSDDKTHYKLSLLTLDGTVNSPVASTTGTTTFNFAWGDTGDIAYYYPSSFSFDGTINSPVVTLEGTISGAMSHSVSNSKLIYFPSSLSFTGNFTPAVLGYDGDLSATFAEEMVGDETIIYPTSLSFNGEIDTEIMKFSGNITLGNIKKYSYYSPTTGAYLFTIPQQFVFDGAIESDPLTISGNFTLNTKAEVLDPLPFWVDPYYVDHNTNRWNCFIATPESCMITGRVECGPVLVKADQISWNNNTRALTVSGGEISGPLIKFTGDGEFKVVNNSYGPNPYQTSLLSVNGTYSNTTPQPSTYTGTWTYSCNNASTACFSPSTEDERLNFPRQKVDVNVNVTGCKLPVFQFITSAARDSYYKESATLFYGHGLNTLSGSVSSDRSADQKVVALTLLNQYGIKFDVTLNFEDDSLSRLLSASGTIKNGKGETLATLDTVSPLIGDCGMLIAHYSDGAFESLF